MKNKIVIFDLDDTLLPNVVYFEKTKNQLEILFKQLFKENFNKELFIEELNSIDLKKIKKLCLNRTRFPLAAVELYLNYCKRYNKDISQDELDEVFVTASTVFNFVEEISEDIKNTINILKNEGFKVFILTRGDEVVQTFKIYKSKIYQIVDNENIIIVPEKNKEVYFSYFSKYGMQNCCMIGNSRKSDINPALEVGMFAIYLPKETWKYDCEELKNNNRVYTVDDISLVPNVLNKMFTKTF